MVITTREGLKKEIVACHPAHDGTVFEFLDTEGEKIFSVKNGFQKPSQDLALGKYQLAIFVHQNWPESRVLILEEEGHGIGHIFSAETLSGDNSVLQSITYGDAIGFITIQKLCLGETFNRIRIAQIEIGEVLSLQDVLPENLVIAIVSAERLPRVSNPGQDVNEYLRLRLPAFAKIGLHLAKEAGSNLTFDKPSNTQPELAKKIILQPCAINLPKSAKSFLIDVVLAIVPFEQHPTFRFFLSYQFFEVLMEDMRTQYAASFVAKVSAGLTASEQWELIDSFEKSAVNKIRLGRLFHANGKGALFQDLTTDCNKLVTSVGSKEKDSCASALYETRNLLFHRFSDASNLSSAVQDASDSLFRVVCHVALNYEAPIITL
jgi:hypothetical protein